MNNQKVKFFEANKRDYKLEVTTDLFGCTGVTVRENGVYKGMIDMADENDFQDLESKIKQDEDFTNTLEVWC